MYARTPLCDLRGLAAQDSNGFSSSAHTEYSSEYSLPQYGHRFISGLTSRAQARGTNQREPRSGTDSANGSWLRRLVRRHLRHISNNLSQLIAQPSTNRSLTILQGNIKLLIALSTFPDQAALV